MDKQDRYRGSLLGLAVGDALGTTLEFTRPGPHDLAEMVGGGPFGLRPGEWTDDTSMALCLATSLVECRGFDAHDQMERYVRWWQEGYLASNGRCFDIGNTTRSALSAFVRTGNPYVGSTDARAAGNGSIMRLAPVPLFFANAPRQALERAEESSRTTHAAQTCLDACRYLAGLIVGAIHGASKEELLSPRYSPVAGYWQQKPLVAEIDEVASGSFIRKNPPVNPPPLSSLSSRGEARRQIRGTGYVVKSLEAALWAFYHGATFEDGCLRAVNLGEDADTTGAVYGQLAGAHYGASGIPRLWLEKLAQRDLIARLADELFSLAERERDAV